MADKKKSFFLSFCYCYYYYFFFYYLFFLLLFLSELFIDKTTSFTIDVHQNRIPSADKNKKKGKMYELLNCVCQSWIEHPVFVPHCWTVYNITVRFSHNRSGTFWRGSVLFITGSGTAFSVRSSGIPS